MTLLRLEDLSVSFRSSGGTLSAVRNVTLDIAPGETVGLVGESGCGKSSLAKAAVGLVQVSSGRVLLDGTDVTAALRRRSKRVLGRIQLIFQDPNASLNPRMTVGEMLAEAVAAHHRLGRVELRAEVSRLLDIVGLSDRAMDRRPRDFSGGQRQRIGIARALAVKPSILIADEITSALDVSVQASILNLVRGIQRETGVACLFISHDLSVVRYMSDRVAVMHLGQLVEQATTAEVFASPRHPYTRVLLGSIPTVTASPRTELRLRALKEPVDPHRPPSGCDFRTRCPVGPERDAARTVCIDVDPQMIAGEMPHHAACHFPMQAEADSAMSHARTPASPSIHVEKE